MRVPHVQQQRPRVATMCASRTCADSMERCAHRIAGARVVSSLTLKIYALGRLPETRADVLHHARRRRAVERPELVPVDTVVSVKIQLALKDGEGRLCASCAREGLVARTPSVHLEQTSSGQQRHTRRGGGGHDRAATLTTRACGVRRAARTGLLSVVPGLMSCTMLKVVPSKDQSSNPLTPSCAVK